MIDPEPIPKPIDLPQVLPNNEASFKQVYDQIHFLYEKCFAVNAAAQQPELNSISQSLIAVGTFGSLLPENQEESPENEYALNAQNKAYWLLSTLPRLTNTPLEHVQQAVAELSRPLNLQYDDPSWYVQKMQEDVLNNLLNVVSHGKTETAILEALRAIKRFTESYPNDVNEHSAAGKAKQYIINYPITAKRAREALDRKARMAKL